MLSQLSYRPIRMQNAKCRMQKVKDICPLHFAFCISVVGVGGLEPPTSILSGWRSNQLSYTPTDEIIPQHCEAGAASGEYERLKLPRKEVIQPHLPVRLPCYDFVPVAPPALGRCPPPVTAGWPTDFRPWQLP